MWADRQQPACIEGEKTQPWGGPVEERIRSERVLLISCLHDLTDYLLRLLEMMDLFLWMDVWNRPASAHFSFVLNFELGNIKCTDHIWHPCCVNILQPHGFKENRFLTSLPSCYSGQAFSRLSSSRRVLSAQVQDVGGGFFCLCLFFFFFCLRWSFFASVSLYSSGSGLNTLLTKAENADADVCHLQTVTSPLVLHPKCNTLTNVN